MLEVIPHLAYAVRGDGTWVIRSNTGSTEWTLNNSAGVIWSLYFEPKTKEAAAELLSRTLKRGSQDKIKEVVEETTRLLQEHQLLRPTLEAIYAQLPERPFTTPEMTVQTTSRHLGAQPAACNCAIVAACNCATL